MKVSKSILLNLSLMLLASSLFAQKSDTLELRFDERGQLSFGRYVANEKSNRKLSAPIGFLKASLNAKAENEFRLTKTEQDDLGTKHQQYQQYYKGIKVEGGIYLIHGKNDAIEVINGNFVDLNIASVSPARNESQSLNSALRFVNAAKYSWEDKASEKTFKELMNDPNATHFPKGELVIAQDYLSTSKNWVLAWKFTISSLEPFDSREIFVDANSGKVINSVALICNSNAAGTAQTIYSGTRGITSDFFTSGNSAYRLRENRNGVNVQTMNLQRTTSSTNAIDFIDFDNNWTAAEHNNAFKDQAALDEHWAIESILDYWRIVHNRNSINGSGLRVISYVHYGNNVVNAFWNGTEQVMYYGDGNGTTYSPLTTIDVSAHEFGHGIDQFESNLVYQGESGALDEGLADIWGAVIEYWAAPTKQRWLVGEEFGGPFRSMSNPNLYQDPDTYGGTYWVNPSSGGDNGGVHTNSGVANFWFYLLTEGGTGTNDLNNCYNVTGIGIDKAARIAYRGEANYLTSNATFLTARDAMIQSARDIYGINSQEVVSVTNAWYAVGVGPAYQYNGNDIVGPNIICSSGATETLIGAPSGVSVTWTVVPYGLFSPSSGTGTVANLQPASPSSKGYATITFTIGNCSGSTTPVWFSLFF